VRIARFSTEVKARSKDAALGLQQSPGRARFLDTLRRQVHVGPAGEAIFAVPAGFAVPKEHEPVHALNYNAATHSKIRMEFILKNWALVAIAAVSGGMLLWPLLRAGSGGPWVNTLQATQLMNREDALVIDLRPRRSLPRATSSARGTCRSRSWKSAPGSSTSTRPSR
jgi:hypothetical protein